MKRFLLCTSLSIILLFSGLYLSSAGILVLNGLSHENLARPGETYRGSIKIQNAGKKDKDVKVYQRDYWFSYKGESKHDSAGTMERSNADWITFNPELLTLEPGETASVDFEVTVPANDSIKGAFWSVIMVEGIVPLDTSNIEKGVKINTAIRYAIQVITEIGNTGKSNLQFIGMELAKQENKNVLYVAVENTGERLLRPLMNLELFDESGNSAGIIKSDIKKTMPGTSILSTLVLEGIKPGNYNCVLVADCGEDRLYGTNLSLDIK